MTTPAQSATSSPAPTADATTGAPPRAGAILATLIIIAAVANLPLAMANIALPSIGVAFDASQTQLNLVAVGYSLGLACSVLWLGALGDRYGRKQIAMIGVTLAIPAALLSGFAVSIEMLIFARLFGGFAAGMAYPTTLALIAALWGPGPGRTHAIALWAAVGGAISVSGPLVSGIILNIADWPWVFFIVIPLAVVALLLAMRNVPSHVNEGTEAVDNTRRHPVGAADRLLRARDQHPAAGRHAGDGDRAARDRARGRDPVRHPPAAGPEPAVRPEDRRPARRSGSPASPGSSCSGR